ncbi:unnamed protein product, partial [Gulo gulo]
VVALGSRCALAALAEAGLVAPVVHGADLVAVTLWTDTCTACGQDDLWASSVRTPTRCGPSSLQPALRHPPVVLPAPCPRELTAARGSTSLGKTVLSWFPSVHYPLFLPGRVAVWPGAAPTPLWAAVSICVTGGSAAPSTLQSALRLL